MLQAAPALALDIGTRKVVGLLTQPGRRGLRIVAAARCEHPTRAMFDGQVHDVAAVADAVRQVKARLQARTGLTLREAAVAAAGRSLRTCRGTAVRTHESSHLWTPSAAQALELEAVQAAQSALRSAPQAGEHHYVGHSVTGCRLGGQPIGALAGQRGAVAEVEVIATFLPRLVIDALQAVLDQCELELTGLTLEPIAAISVVVPQNMRHLHLALVDVGAGTSDIAITQRGAVIAYDMVPVAGDEITEALAQHYLLDFPTGERIKRALTAAAPLSFTDVLGQTRTPSAADVAAVLAPAVHALAELVAERIRALGGGPPQAVVLVGGGALTPGLAGALAACLGLPADRVAVRGRAAIAGVEGCQATLSGPDAVTPIGIAVVSGQAQQPGFAYVTVQGQGVRLLGPGPHSVADALLAAGVPVRELQGRPGPGLTVTVNGQLHLVPGGFGRPAVFTLDGEPAGLDTPVRHRAALAWSPPVPGEPAAATVAEVIDFLPKLHIQVDGRPVAVPPLIRVGDQPAQPGDRLVDNANITVRPPETLADALVATGRGEALAWNDLPNSSEGEARRLRRPRCRLWLNGRPAEAGAAVQDGDEVRIEPLLTRPLRLLVNGSPVEFKEGVPIFADLLLRLRFSPTPPPGKQRLHMAVNGQPAQFVTPLVDGDRVDLDWE